MAGPEPIAFDPPAGYGFEPELTGPAPRPLPDLLNDGPYASQVREKMLRAFAFGSMCLLLNRVPGVDTLAYYFLPLAYLNLIGLAWIVLTVMSAIYYALRLGPFRYVQNGVPLVARIANLSTATVPMSHGGAIVHKATVVYAHPHSGAITRAVVKSRNLPVLRSHEFVLPFKVGDYATAVYLPRNVEESLQLYAFLDLNAQVNTHIVPTPESSRRTTLRMLALLSVVVVPLAALYALKRYEPLEFGFAQGAVPAAGGSLLGMTSSTSSSRGGGATCFTACAWASWRSARCWLAA